MYAQLPAFGFDPDIQQDVALAAIYVSSKMHDTLKKPRELLATSYALLHHVPKSKAPGGEVDIDSMDQQESLRHFVAGEQFTYFALIDGRK